MTSGINNRIYRYLFFQLFQAYAEEWFRDVANSDFRHEAREKYLGFYVAKSGRFGGVDKRECDVFYGLRPFDRVREIESLLKPPNERLLVQNGGGLTYRRSDDGYVSCFLYPPMTKDRQLSTDAFVLGRHLNPRALLSKAVVKYHFGLYSACFECCDLDGNPTLIDRVRFLWLRLVHKRIVNGKVANSVAWTRLGRAIELAFTIGLSGFLLAIIELLFKRPP